MNIPNKILLSDCRLIGAINSLPNGTWSEDGMKFTFDESIKLPNRFWKTVQKHYKKSDEDYICDSSELFENFWSGNKCLIQTLSWIFYTRKIIIQH